MTQSQPYYKKLQAPKIGLWTYWQFVSVAMMTQFLSETLQLYTAPCYLTLSSSYLFLVLHGCVGKHFHQLRQLIH